MPSNTDTTACAILDSVTVIVKAVCTPFAEDKLQIVIPGGTVGDISQWVEDQPIFHESTRVRIYFQERDGGFSIVCAQFGVEEI